MLAKQESCNKIGGDLSVKGEHMIYRIACER